MRNLPRNEFGFAICLLPNGNLVRGPVSHGTPTSVEIQLRCQQGARFVGLGHTHPGGVAYPSRQDIKSGLESKSEFLAIKSDNDIGFFPIRRG